MSEILHGDAKIVNVLTFFSFYNPYAHPSAVLFSALVGLFFLFCHNKQFMPGYRFNRLT